ncbi:MAG TPA: tRNA (guanosine(37)-N1)-methyltransferase TrmD [Firmicutes bacterium]|nr:tRNA (guanosine(37)-N1)-methyltransferase TrmD [Bacillota bacterium]
MNVYILTLFPGMFSPVVNTSIIKRAQEQGLVRIKTVDVRGFAQDAHKTVDDYLYGGGPGMVLKPEPVFEAVDWVKQELGRQPFVVLLTPQGQTLTAGLARELAHKPDLVLISGHYEGFDERIRCLADIEVSIGDYVLTGGELAAMVVLDASIRFVPGVLGDSDSALQDSFSDGLLEGPQYTRPAEYRGLKVPDILLTGRHEDITRWRRKEAIRRTLRRRPELLKVADLTFEDRCLLEQVINEEKANEARGDNRGRNQTN